MSPAIISMKNTHLFFGGVSDESVSDAIQALCAIKNKHLQPHLLLSSSGGDADPGFAFYDTVQLLGLNHSVTVTAEVASIAILLLLSASFEKRFITKNGYLFLHKFRVENEKGKEVVVNSKGFYKLQRSSQEGVLLQQGLYIDTVSQKLKINKKKVFDLMRNERYLSPKDALKYRFVSKIV